MEPHLSKGDRSIVQMVLIAEAARRTRSISMLTMAFVVFAFAIGVALQAPLAMQGLVVALFFTALWTGYWVGLDRAAKAWENAGGRELAMPAPPEFRDD